MEKQGKYFILNEIDNFVEFDIEKAKQGYQVVTRDGEVVPKENIIHNKKSNNGSEAIIYIDNAGSSTFLHSNGVWCLDRERKYDLQLNLSKKELVPGDRVQAWNCENDKCTGEYAFKHKDLYYLDYDGNIEEMVTCNIMGGFKNIEYIPPLFINSHGTRFYDRDKAHFVHKETYEIISYEVTRYLMLKENDINTEALTKEQAEAYVKENKPSLLIDIMLEIQDAVFNILIVNRIQYLELGESGVDTLEQKGLTVVINNKAKSFILI